MEVTVWRRADTQLTDKSQESGRQAGGRTDGGVVKILRHRALGQAEVEAGQGGGGGGGGGV